MGKRAAPYLKAIFLMFSSAFISSYIICSFYLVIWDRFAISETLTNFLHIKRWKWYIIYCAHNRTHRVMAIIFFGALILICILYFLILLNDLKTNYIDFFKAGIKASGYASIVTFLSMNIFIKIAIKSALDRHGLTPLVDLISMLSSFENLIKAAVLEFYSPAIPMIKILIINELFFLIPYAIYWIKSYSKLSRRENRTRCIVFTVLLIGILIVHLIIFAYNPTFYDDFNL